MTTAASLLPTVIVIDIDGTIVGSVAHLMTEFEVHVLTHTHAAASTSSTHSTSSSRCGRKQMRDSIVDRLRYGIIRPQFAEFVRWCQRERGHEIFIYTASTLPWASFLVPCIEDAIQSPSSPAQTQSRRSAPTFNRPIFARNRCLVTESGALRKSIDRLRPQIFGALKGRYPDLRSPDMLTHRMVMIDNTADIMATARDAQTLVVCPTYQFLYAYDVLTTLTPALLHGKYAAIAQMLHIPCTGVHDFLAAYYAILAREAAAASSSSNLRAMRKDRFWSVMRDALAKFVKSAAVRRKLPFTPERVVAINRYVASRVSR